MRAFQNVIISQLAMLLPERGSLHTVSDTPFQTLLGELCAVQTVVLSAVIKIAVETGVTPVPLWFGKFGFSLLDLLIQKRSFLCKEDSGIF